jgi:tetratricopeptide (TPR) repeat protein
MLVTTVMIRVVMGAVLVASTVSFSRAEPANLHPDPGAGPVRISIGSCLIAKQTHRGVPCPEPQIAASASKAEQVKGRLARARFFIEMQKIEKAYAEVKSALAIAPEDVGALHLAARLALNLHDLPAAEANLALARKLAPKDADIEATAAFLPQLRQANIESLRSFNALLRKHPGHRFAREQRADLLMRIGRPHAALAAYQELIQTSAPDIDLLTGRAEALLAVGRAADAAADYGAALLMSPDRSDLMIARAKALAAAGDNANAVRQFDAVLATTSGVPVYPMFRNERAKALMGRAHALVGLKRLDDAAADAIAAVTIGGRPAVLRAQVLLRRNGFPDVPIDGQNSDALRKALSLCFGLDACFQVLSQAI